MYVKEKQNRQQKNSLQFKAERQPVLDERRKIAFPPKKGKAK